MIVTKDDYYHSGLTDEEVLRSRERYGTNLLTPPKRPSLWKLYLEKFEDPVVRVLLFCSDTFSWHIRHRERVCRDYRYYCCCAACHGHRLLF